MSKIEAKNYGTDIVQVYSLNTLANRSDALFWIANISLMQEIVTKKIVVEDFKSFHDGTLSKSVSINSAKEFVAEYENSDYIGVDVDAIFEEVPFLIGINLDSCKVVISYQATSQLNIQKLEQLLGLV